MNKAWHAGFPTGKLLKTLTLVVARLFAASVNNLHQDLHAVIKFDIIFL